MGEIKAPALSETWLKRLALAYGESLRVGSAPCDAANRVPSLAEAVAEWRVYLPSRIHEADETAAYPMTRAFPIPVIKLPGGQYHEDPEHPANYTNERRLAQPSAARASGLPGSLNPAGSALGALAVLPEPNPVYVFGVDAAAGPDRTAVSVFEYKDGQLRPVQGTCRPITAMPPRKGEFVTCEGEHLVCEVVAELEPGWDQEWVGLGAWRAGADRNGLCQCGKPWFKYRCPLDRIGPTLHIKGRGWV